VAGVSVPAPALSPPSPVSSFPHPALPVPGHFLPELIPLFSVVDYFQLNSRWSSSSIAEPGGIIFSRVAVRSSSASFRFSGGKSLIEVSFSLKASIQSTASPRVENFPFPWSSLACKVHHVPVKLIGRRLYILVRFFHVTFFMDLRFCGGVFGSISPLFFGSGFLLSDNLRKSHIVLVAPQGGECYH